MAKKTFYIKTLLELIQNVEIETPLGTTNFRMLTSCKIQLATLFLNEEVLSPLMILEWIIAGCKFMPAISKENTEFSLADLKMLKKDASNLLSPRFDYAKSTPTKEQPVAYEPPHRRNSITRSWRSTASQTSAFELMDWTQFQQFRMNRTNASTSN